MKKGLLFLFLFTILSIFSFSQTTLKRQAYWGAAFIPKPANEAGVTVQRITNGSPAQLAGLQNGDWIIKVNAIPINNAYTWGKIFRSLRAGDKPVFTLLRNGKLMELPLTASARQLEKFDNVDVEYGSVITDKGHQVRTIITKPASAKGRIPVIFLTQWLSCSQMEINQLVNLSGTSSLLTDLITKSGYAVVRVEKPGLGDSDGPDCSETDYESELATYRAAFKAMKQKDFIDTNSVYVLGISIGSASGPLVFQNENIKGYIVTGGFYKTWYEHMLEIERKRLALIGTKEGEITSMLRKYADFYNDYLNYKKTPDEILKSKPYLNGIWYDDPAHQYGRPVIYYQQVQDKNVAATWEKIKAPALVIFGEYDWIMSKDDHEAMAAAVNRNNKGAGTFLLIPKMGHNLTVHPSLQDAFNDTNGVYATEVSEQILKWLKNH